MKYASKGGTVTFNGVKIMQVVGWDVDEMPPKIAGKSSSSRVNVQIIYDNDEPSHITPIGTVGDLVLKPHETAGVNISIAECRLTGRRPAGGVGKLNTGSMSFDSPEPAEHI